MTAEPVVASVHIDAPPERVYEYFTRPAALVTWMGDYALLEAEPGGQFTVDVKGAPVRGRFLDLDPPRRLLISWGYAGSDRLPPGASTVEVRFTPERGGTRVDLEHRDLPAEERPGHAVGWAHYLGRLTMAGAGRDPGPDPGMPTPQQAAPAPRPGSHQQDSRFPGNGRPQLALTVWPVIGSQLRRTRVRCDWRGGRGGCSRGGAGPARRFP